MVNKWLTHSHGQVYQKGSDRYADLVKTSPTYQKHSRCAQLTQKGYDSTLKNAEKYLRDGVVCFAEALGLFTAVDSWKFCLSGKFGDYDLCMDDFRRT